MPPKRSERSPPPTSAKRSKLSHSGPDERLRGHSNHPPTAHPSQPAPEPYTPNPHPANESAAIFSNASGFVIDRPQFAQKITNKSILNQFDSGKVGLDHLLPYVCPGAAVDSSERDPPPLCHPGTREEIQSRMSTWFDDERREWNMIWLTGPAGTGKSAVAQTFAEFCVGNSRLGAAFFFSRPNERDKPDTVIPTLAYQLAVHFPDYRPLLMDRIVYDPTILHKTPRAQLMRLIVEPFSALQLRGHPVTRAPLLILLDGLDECQGIPAQREFVEMIGEVVRLKKGLPLLWLICSRPEPHLKHIFSRPHFAIDCLREELLIDAKTKDDVDLYLRDSFAKLRDEFCDVVNPSWPSKTQLDKVSKITSGLFVLASTIVKYLGDPIYANPMARLVTLLEFMRNAHRIGMKNPLEALDLFYSNILADIPDEILPVTKRILGLQLELRSSHYGSLPIRTLCNFLNVDRNDLYAALRKLHSVLDVPPPEDVPKGRLRFYHASFEDYLTNPIRSGKFALNLDEARAAIAALCPYSYKIDSGLFPIAGTNPLNSLTRTSEGDIAHILQTRILNSEDCHQTLLEVNGSNAQRILDILHRSLSCHLVDGSARQSILPAIVRISVVSGLLPQALRLHGIEYESPRVHCAGTAEIYKCQYQGRQVCLKRVKLSDGFGYSVLTTFFQEAAMLSQLAHPNILPFYGIYHEPSAHRVGIVSAWMENGNLRDYLKAHSDVVRLPFVHDILAGIQYLHHHQIVHGSLSGGNILIKDDTSACLADFGTSTMVDSEVLRWVTFPYADTIPWQAPELLLDPRDGQLSPHPGSDIYSLACTMLETFTGEDPFPPTEIVATKKQGITPNRPEPEAVPELTDNIWQIMQDCWSFRPSERPTVDEVIARLPEASPPLRQAGPTEDWLWRPESTSVAAEISSDKMFLMNFFNLD